MKLFKLKTLSSLILAGSATFAGTASAAVVTFDGMPSAVFGAANESGTKQPGNCGGLVGGCFVQNGIVVGGVVDPLDAGGHIHYAETAGDAEAQYHPDSTGVYVRMDDLSSFSLQSINLNVTNGSAGGNFVLYGYANATNPGLLTSNVGTPFSGGKANPTDPEGGTVTPIASYVLPNDDIFNGTLDLATLGSAWGDIGSFWLTFQGKNHSPTVSYAAGSYPLWDIRIDDINLGAVVTAPPAEVPLPGAVWLFGSALAGFVARRKKAAV
jgi:hypothetical protein